MPLVAYSTQAASYPYILAPHSDSREEEKVQHNPRAQRIFEEEQIDMTRIS